MNCLTFPPVVLVSRRPARSASAFTLIELLTVIAIMSMMMALIAPMLLGLKGTRDMGSSAAQIAGTLDQARAYAMANNTYVFVGIAEVDASVDSSARPQVNAGASPYGRVAVAVVASRDGTKHSSTVTTDQGSDWQSTYGKGDYLTALGKLQRFENLHLASSNPPPASGPMARPDVSRYYILGNASCASTTPFSWPLGSQLTGGYQYRFDKVIQFDPQGVARITYASNGDEIRTYMEIGLQPTNGVVVSSGPNVAAIQIDCMVGTTRIYRP